MIERICKTCMWRKKGVCLCEDSEQRFDSTDEFYSCDEWKQTDSEETVEKPVIVEGFEVADRPTVDGIARGLRYAVGFCDDNGTDKEALEELATVLERESEWLF